MENETLWEDGTNGPRTLEHYGYSPEDYLTGGVSRGFWPNDGTALEKLKNLPEYIQLAHPAQKIRIVFDYDPEYPRALIQVFSGKWGEKQCTND